MAYHADIPHIHQQIEHIWLLVRDAHIQEARVKSEQLVQQIQSKVEHRHNDKALQHKLIGAYHVAGYTVAMSTRSYDALIPAVYFGEMETLARKLEDDAQVAIALTYQGDMYRRYGDLQQAFHFLEAAYHLPHSDDAVRGNCAQLLGRVYAERNDHKRFLSMMEEAEHIALLHDDSSHNSLHGQYCLGTVYADYTRYYCNIGHFQKALEYYSKAEATLPETPHWTTFLTATHGLLLVKSGNIEKGMPDILKAVELANKHGNHRLLDKFYALQLYLGRKTLEFNRANIRLGDLLHGIPVNEYALLTERGYNEFPKPV